MNKRNVLLKIYQEQNKKTLKKLDKGGMFKSFDEEEQAKIQGAGMIAGAGVDIISPVDKYGTRSKGGAAASGAVKGAMAGAALGPAGMAGGAVLGAVTSLMANKKALEAKQQLLTETSEADAKVRDARVESRIAGDNTLTYGRASSKMYKYGGTVKGKPAGKFNLSMTMPKSVNLAPDLLPNIAVNPNKMEFGGDSGPDKPVAKVSKKPRPYQPDITLPNWDGLVEKADGTIAMWGNDWPDKKPELPLLPALPMGSTDHNGRLSGHKYQGTESVRDKIFEKEKALKAASNMKGYKNGGEIKATSSSTSLVKGPSHENGGVKLYDKGVEVEGGESIAGDFVFSDALGFAEIHDRIGKAMGKNEKRPDTVLNKRTQVALKRKEGFLKIYQEEAKRKAGLPNEIDNTIQELKGGQATRPMVMRLGGEMPKMQDGGKIRAKVNGVWRYITPAEKAAIDARAAANIKPFTEGGTPAVRGETNFDKMVKGLKNAFQKDPNEKPTQFKNRLMDVAPPTYRKPTTKISSVPPPPKTDPDTGKVVQTKPVATTSPKRSGSGGKGKPTVKSATFDHLPEIGKIDILTGASTKPTESGIKLELPKTTTAIGLPVENAAPGQSNGKTKLGDVAGALAPFASNIANAFRKLPAPPKPIMDDEIDPNLINLDASRSEAVRQRRGADKVAAATLNGNNAVAATKAANLTAQMREMNDINQTEQNANTQIKNQTQAVNSQIKRGNNLKQDYFNTQQVERQLKQQQLNADNLADVGNKMQAISRDKAAAALDDDKMLLTIAQDDTGATIRAGDAVLKRRLSPEGYKAITELGKRMEESNAEDRKLLRAQMTAILENTKASTETILADRKTKEGLLKDDYTKARTNKANK